MRNYSVGQSYSFRPWSSIDFIFLGGKVSPGDTVEVKDDSTMV